MAASIVHSVYQVPDSRWYQTPYLVPLLMTSSVLIYATYRAVGKPADSSAKFDPATSKQTCRYRLDNSTSATFTLPDGRQLGYAEYGSPTGRPVICLHGLPGSRIEIAALDEMAMRAGARIIGVDRPGYGWSSPHPGRTLLAHAKDVEQLAKHLELDEYGVIFEQGTSGGGPYALACAASAPPNKLKAAAVVVGLGSPDMSRRGMNWWNWLGLAFGFRYFPNVVRWYFRRDIMARLDVDDEKRLEILKKQLLGSKPDEKDTQFFNDEEAFNDFLRLTLRSSREAFAQGTDSFAQDGRLVCSEFGFRLEDIRSDLPVHLWYGKFDTNVPPVHGEQIAARIGGKAQLHMRDETHLSLWINCREEALKELVRIM